MYCNVENRDISTVTLEEKDHDSFICTLSKGLWKVENAFNGPLSHTSDPLR